MTSPGLRLQLACTWAGPAFIAVFFGGIALTGWFPPPSPNHSAAHWAHEYQAHADRIRMGAVLIGSASMAQGIWAAVMSVQMRRIEGDRPLMTYVQLGAGAVGILVVIIPAFLFGAIAFAPYRDPDVTKALHDFAFLCLVGMGWPAALQAFAVGVVTLAYPQDVFPRWFGWLNLWAIFGFVPGGFIIFFHSGAFAWNGVGEFWIPASVFGVWFGAWFVVLRRSIRAEAAA